MAAPDAASPVMDFARRVDRYLRHRDGLHWPEALFWLALVVVPLLAPARSGFGAQVLVMMLFALSIDLATGYAGVVTLGHAAFFGIGAYAAGLLSAKLGWHEPISGLLVATLVSAVAGALAGAVLLRYRELTLLMLTLALAALLYELANTASEITGGFDGLIGIEIDPIFGRFEWDLDGVTGYYYALGVLFVGFVLLRLATMSPFGQALFGLRENTLRMHALGAPVFSYLLSSFTLSAALAGAAGAVFTQISSFVTMQVLGFDQSAGVVTMVILGGTGRLYGALIGCIVYMLSGDQLAKLSPAYWQFGVGVLLVAVVLLLPDGLMGLVDRLRNRLRKA